MRRDQATKALVETDREALDKYREERQRVAQVITLRKEVEQMKTQIDDLYKTVCTLKREKAVSNGKD